MSYDVIVIGAGTAGLSAFKEVLTYTDNACLVDHGPLGTTCARVGCMPSKVLIQIADDFYRQHLFAERGISGHLDINVAQSLAYVRQLRDEWVRGVVDSTKQFGDKLMCGAATFVDDHTVQVNDQVLKAARIIIATGSVPVMPEAWCSLPSKLLTSDNLFEQKRLPKSLGVVGLGVIGIELGQALAHMGLTISGVTHGTQVAGLSDPVVNKIAIDILSKSFPIYTGVSVEPVMAGDQVCLSEAHDLKADGLLVAVGRRPNLGSLNLNNTSIELDDKGVPTMLDERTMQIQQSPLFIAGDVASRKPLLHEAADEGRIAGYNATHDVQCFKRRCPISIVFCHPNIAMVGQSFSALEHHAVVIGEARFENQGRSRIIGENAGILRVYADQQTGLLLGAEMVAPEGEHLAHLLAWAIQDEQTVFDVLRKPYYHPSVEEGLRTALRDAGRQVTQQPSHPELVACASGPIESLS